LEFLMRLWSVAAAAALLPLSSVVAVAQTANFGYPPSGRVPILFNDHHVYAKPNELRRGRLLAAIVRGSRILLPLRSLFERMGATVKYDRRTRSTVVRATGLTVVVTVGAHVVRINGEERPLDVPPEVRGGQVLVPVRVLAESLGAYVEYERGIRAVVIRYVSPAAPTPQPVPGATAAPVTVPPVAPVPRQTVPPGPPIPIGTPPPETFVAADVAIAPRVADAFAPNVTGATGQSFAVRGATEFTLFAPFEIDGEYERYAFPHPSGAVSVIGGSGSTFVPAFVARDDETSVHLGAQFAPQKYYLAAGYISLGNEYGYPKTTGFGAGIEKLPVLSDRLSYDASAFFYPNVSGTCGTGACPAGPYTVSYRVVTFSAGLTYSLGPAFLEAGYRGDRGANKAFAPAGFSHDAPFVGLGLHF